MSPKVQLRASVTKPQAEKLQQRLSALPFKVGYQEQQHGALLLVLIGCTVSEGKIVHDILIDLGVSMGDSMEA